MKDKRARAFVFVTISNDNMIICDNMRTLVLSTLRHQKIEILTLLFITFFMSHIIYKNMQICARIIVYCCKRVLDVYMLRERGGGEGER